MRLRLPSISPCARVGFAVWGTVFALVVLLLWLSASLSGAEPASQAASGDNTGLSPHVASRTDSR